MIRYALACEAGHGFDSWFRSSEDFERQDARGLVMCPVCGSARVTKQIMAPQVARTDHERPDHERTGAGAPQAESEAAALIDPQAQEVRRKIALLRAHLLANSEDVGEKFADEARKMHYGDTEERAIYGKATGEDARALIDEGIGVLPIPGLPDERN